jgi:transcriptional regulator GlxA family with amidase domain
LICSAACGCSRRTLERLFQEADWTSISDTIAAKRLSRAKNLLRETRLGIKQVAGDTGFSSPQHFIACFHRWEKCTPSQFRRRKEQT